MLVGNFSTMNKKERKKIYFKVLKINLIEKIVRNILYKLVPCHLILGREEIYCFFFLVGLFITNFFRQMCSQYYLFSVEESRISLCNINISRFYRIKK